MSYDFILDPKKFLKAQTDLEPKPDIAICSECNWSGPISECVKDEEGDWETGYYPIDLCPVCLEEKENGGCIDDYDYSPEQLKLLNEYMEKEIVKAFQVPANMIGKNK